MTRMCKLKLLDLVADLDWQWYESYVLWQIGMYHLRIIRYSHKGDLHYDVMIQNCTPSFDVAKWLQREGQVETLYQSNEHTAEELAWIENLWNAHTLLDHITYHPNSSGYYAENGPIHTLSLNCNT